MVSNSLDKMDRTLDKTNKIFNFQRTVMERISNFSLMEFRKISIALNLEDHKMLESI